MRLPDGPIFVAPLPSQVSGVDFLGLAAVNERLAALALPGITNITRYMRAYSAMCWLVWRFAQHMSQIAARKPISEREIAKQFRQFREKVELLFTLGNPDYTQIAGQTRRGLLPENGKRFPLEFSAFGDYKISWFDAAVYGPSLGVESGLGFIARAPGNSYRPTDLGEELAKALDELLRKSKFYDALTDIESITGSTDMIDDLAKRWTVRQSTAKERTCFRKALTPENAGAEGTNLAANRVAMIHLILAAVELLGGSASVDEVRQTVARGVSPRRKPLRMDGTEKTQAMWAVLQLRQLQRLSHESLLRWLELTLMSPPTDLKGRTPAALAELAASQAAQYFNLDPMDDLEVVLNQFEAPKDTPDFYLAGLSSKRLDPFEWLGIIQSLRNVETDTARLPGAALAGLVISAKQASFLTLSERHAPFLSIGRAGRLSLQSLVGIFASYQNATVSEFIRFLVESCVIGQHFKTTNAKLEPNKNKYRFIRTDEGLRLLIRESQVTRLNVTGDRLDNAMELMVDCGLLDWHGDDDSYHLP